MMISFLIYLFVDFIMEGCIIVDDRTVSLEDRLSCLEGRIVKIENAVEDIKSVHLHWR